MDTSASAAAVLTPGTWTVDPDASSALFRSRGMFGLVAVSGSFETIGGALTVTDAGVSGELVVDAASLDTKNDKRDKHLRSPDFFDVDINPTVRFRLDTITPGNAPQLRGALIIKQTELAVSAPLTVEPIGDDSVRLSTSLAVDRAEAGVGWSKLGMVQGPAHLDVEVTVVRA